MAGCPIRRARKTGALDPATGEVVAFPFLPRVTRVDKPPGWNRWPPAQKVEHLLSMSLDRCYETLSWSPVAGLDPHRQSVQVQVIRVILMIGTKALLDGKLGREAARERNRAAILDEIDHQLRACATPEA
jgi:hypothetical protein